MELLDCASNRQFLLSRSAAIRYILAKVDVPKSEEEGLKLCRDESARVWIENGWGASLSYFVSTLDNSYSDWGPAHGETSRRILQEMIDRDGFPPEPPVAPSANDAVPFEYANQDETLSLGEALLSRRTVLRPTRGSLPRSTVRAVVEHGLAKVALHRADPPEVANLLTRFGVSLDIYLVVYDVENMQPGVYQWFPESLRLYGHRYGNFRTAMVQALVGQPAPRTSACSVLCVANYERFRWRYRHERALRLLWIDTAKVVSGLLAEAARRRLSVHMTPAIDDDEVAEILGLKSRDTQCVYSISLGARRSN